MGHPSGRMVRGVFRTATAAALVLAAATSAQAGMAPSPFEKDTSAGLTFRTAVALGDKVVDSAWAPNDQHILIALTCDIKPRTLPFAFTAGFFGSTAPSGDVTFYVDEWRLGLRKVLERRIAPYIAGGLAWMHTTVSGGPIPTGASVETKDASGWWVGTGFYVSLTRRPRSMFMGVDLSYSNASVTLQQLGASGNVGGASIAALVIGFRD